jgi:hypothetical protein
MVTTEEVAQRIENNQQIVFVKYGDGEINCMIGVQGHNCDGDPYTPSLSQGLIMSLCFYIQNPQFFVGRWHGEEGIARMNTLLGHFNIGQPTWADYHLVMNDDNFFNKSEMFHLIQSIQNTKRKKIIISNQRNIRMKELLHADTYIVVPENNWFKDFNSYFQLVLKELTPDCLVFTSAGQGSKVLIAQLLTNVPTISCIDFGSSLDLLCSKYNSRGWKHSYEQLVKYYKELLPSNW